MQDIASHFPKVAALDVADNKISSVEHVQALGPQLRYLRASNNLLRSVTVSVIGYSSCVSIPITSPPPSTRSQGLDKCRHLTVLELDNNGLEKLPQLDPACRLSCLSVQNNALVSLPAQPQLLHLEHLAASGNHLHRLGMLATSGMCTTRSHVLKNTLDRSLFWGCPGRWLASVPVAAAS